MGRVLAIDYGTKRIGIAVTDPHKIIASGLTTVGNHEVIGFLKEYMAKENVESFVVGEPKNMDNTPAQSAKGTEAFINLLKKSFPGMPLYRVDERFTSKIAFQTMISGGLKKKDRRNKSTIDMVSAALILQSFLEMEKNNLVK